MTAELLKALDTQQIKDAWEKNGSAVIKLTGKAFGEYVTSEIARWGQGREGRRREDLRLDATPPPARGRPGGVNGASGSSAAVDPSPTLPLQEGVEMARPRSPVPNP